jgi:hypothetical protein
MANEQMAPDGDPLAEVHTAAVEANAACEKLGTALGRAGADKKTLQVMDTICNVTKQLVHAMGPAKTGGQGQPAPEGAPAQPRSTSEATDAMMADMR